MVGNITSLTNNGLKDWLLQRVTAVVIGAYASYLLVFFMLHPELTYSQWQALFACRAMKVATAITSLSLILHAWIGIWTVTTDYLKCACIRLSVQLGVALFLLVFFIWVLAVVWGV